MTDQWAECKRVAIMLDGNGQAVGSNSNQFNKILGTFWNYDQRRLPVRESWWKNVMDDPENNIMV